MTSLIRILGRVASFGDSAWSPICRCSFSVNTKFFEFLRPVTYVRTSRGAFGPENIRYKVEKAEISSIGLDDVLVRSYFLCITVKLMHFSNSVRVDNI